MKEFTHCIRNEKVIFNNVLRSSRNQILCDFGRLNASSFISAKQIDLKLQNISYIFYACLVLHNFCELSNIQIHQELIQAHIKEIHNNDKILQSYYNNIFICNTDEGQLFRDIITNYTKTCLSDHLSTCKYIKGILIRRPIAQQPPLIFSCNIKENMQQTYIEHPCQSVISINLLCKFIETTIWNECSPLDLLYVFQNIFL